MPLKDDSKTCARAIRENASIVRTLFDLFYSLWDASLHFYKEVCPSVCRSFLSFMPAPEPSRSHTVQCWIVGHPGFFSWKERMGHPLLWGKNKGSNYSYYCLSSGHQYSVHIEKCQIDFPSFTIAEKRFPRDLTYRKRSLYICFLYVPFYPFLCRWLLFMLSSYHVK